MRTSRTPSGLLALLPLLTFTVCARAELALPHFFSDHMVLQRECAAAIWGQAEPGGEVAIRFKGRQAMAKADGKGHWKAVIETGKADAQGAEMAITSGGDSVTLHDVLVGEVWFASGQSNMVFTLNRVPAYKAVTDAADDPALRFFLAPQVTARAPQTDIDGEWSLCNAETSPGFSAVAYFFARKLREELKVPVGVIKSAWGGKPIETFTSREALMTIPEGEAKVEEALARDAEYNAERAQKAYDEQLAAWTEKAKAWRARPEAERGRLAKRPERQRPALETEGMPGVLFDAMIHPFIGYTIRGAIWYQGEGNAKAGAIPYDTTLPLMIRDWRKRWGADFSFYFVQLANFHQPSIEPGTPDPWPLLQDRMRHVLSVVPKTGMAVINDVGDANNIHPADKKTPGERLARWALAKDYGRDVVVCGPLYKSHQIEGAALRVAFDHAAGLKSRDGGKLQRFEIAGADHVWHWADAKVDGGTVVVSSTEVPAPLAVRYAWAANPEGANLVNGENLPASVFRTDDWSDVEPKMDPQARGADARRAALRDEIKKLAAERAKLEPRSDEFKKVSVQLRKLMAEWKGGAASETSPSPDK